MGFFSLGFFCLGGFGALGWAASLAGFSALGGYRLMLSMERLTFRASARR